MLQKQKYNKTNTSFIPGGAIYKNLLSSDKGGQSSVFSSQILYTYTDHLGSITHVTDNTGSLLLEQSFNAWGRARNPETLDYTVETHGRASLTNGRGYTGHEMLPNFGIINMNGRLYDPVLGRMLSPDNYIQAPDYTQNFNRYSYVLNNPLKFTDPSGDFITFTDFGYRIMRNISPFAFKINIHFGGERRGIGYDMSWGALSSDEAVKTKRSA